MIERQIIKSNMKELKIQEYVTGVLKNLGQSHIKLQRTPLGEKIVIFASRPGLIVGRKGQNIKKLTQDLKDNFSLENPQIEIEEVTDFALDANIIAEMIVNSLERYGTQRFKGVGHRAIEDVMRAGALGVEILISGRIPSTRARTWRFYQGYLKKCGDVAVTGVNKSIQSATLKSGAVGVKVSILPPTTKLPDKVVLHEPTIEEVTDPEIKEEMEAVNIKRDEFHGEWNYTIYQSS